MAVAVRVDDDPPFLYRYAGISGERAEHLRDMLLNHRLFLPTPKNFNDPFDCKVAFSFAGPEDDWRRSFAATFAKRLPHLSDRERALIVEKAVTQAWYKDPDCQQKFLDFLQNEVDAAGVACFSAVGDDILMWSHYADRHRGICLKFVGNRFEKVFGEAQRINYRADFHLPSVWDNPDALLEYAVLTKADHWRYEHEWRLIRPGGAGTFIPFDPRSLSGLTFGCSVPEADRGQVREWVATRSPPLELFEARRVPDAFALEIVPFKET
jgi:hypothetical protein